jgi:hypothetical protein
MRIQVCAGEGSDEFVVTLTEPEDFANFSLHSEGVRAADVFVSLERERIGRRVTDNEAVVAVDWVRNASGKAGSPTWENQFSTMLTYAAGKGWLSEDGSHILAHLQDDQES